MAQLNINIPDNILNSVVAAFSTDWTPTILPEGTPNPLTRVQHAKRKMQMMLREYVRNVNAQSAAAAAAAAVVEPDITVS